LGQGVVNPEAIRGILGAEFDSYMATMGNLAAGTGDQELGSSESISYAALDPAWLVREILHAIDQPWGVVISDITVRAANDRYVI